jgi:hypothetical protein
VERIVETQLPWHVDEILDVAAVEGAAGAWLVVRRSGVVARLDADSGTPTEACVVELPPPEPDHQAWGDRTLRHRLHVSSGGGFAAVVHDYGRHGRVYDLVTGAVKLELHGGDYHYVTVPFSFAFAAHRGRTVAIHRTAWNRLDVSDAESGRLLTGRNQGSYRRAEEPPEHYLDYFHGRILVSPGGSRILDDGWVWHPMGIPRAWSLTAWLESNVWESEDGPTVIELADRDSYWDHAMCWLDEHRVALGGIGADDDSMVDGVRIFATGEAGPARELAAFPGPAGAFFGDGGRLFCAYGGALTVWDVDAGRMTARIDAFEPSRQHASGRELVQLSGNVMRRWRY